MNEVYKTTINAETYKKLKRVSDQLGITVEQIIEHLLNKIISEEWEKINDPHRTV